VAYSGLNTRNEGLDIHKFGNNRIMQMWKNSCSMVYACVRSRSCIIAAYKRTNYATTL